MISNLHMSNLFLNSTKLFLFLLLGLSILCIEPPCAKAQFEIDAELEKQRKKEEWEHHLSLSGVFETKFPQKYKYKLYPFRYNNDHIAFSAEILASLDGSKENNDKSILIKAVQTFGDSLSLRRAKIILNQEAAKYVRSAKKIGGAVLVNEDIKHHDFPGKRVYYTYFDGDIKYGMRIRIYMTDYAKVEQVLTAPANVMYSYRSDDFFDSLKLFDGITKLEEPKDFAKGWNTHTSNNKAFSVKLPPVNSDYTPNPPKFIITPTKETMYFRIIDPVIGETVFYNIYSYKLKKQISYDLAKRLLFSQHVKKYVENASIESLDTKSSINNHIYDMSARLIIAPPNNRPYLSSLFLKMRYAGDSAIVQEIVSSANHTASGLPDLLLNETLTYHPEKYRAPKPSDITKRVTKKKK